MDYSIFRSSSGEGTAVSVNHKALITRALTKYPVDFALFRELLQNSADAKSSEATIQFETSLPKFDSSSLHGAPIIRLRFSNDGLEFAEDDWNRLREIASGNPNETKIGAFGVGFYSVFELTDEPLVHSGNKIMGFRYQGVQLHYYTNQCSQFQKGTMIDLLYKEPMELVDLVKFTGFLVQNFLMVGLSEISLELKFANGEVKKLLNLQKQIGQPKRLPTPEKFHTRSANKLLNLAYLNKSMLEIRLNFLNLTQQQPLSLSGGLFSFGKQLVSSLITQNGDPLGYTDINCKLVKFDGFADVNVSRSFRAKMIDTLLKPPPKQALLSLISFSDMSNDNAGNQLKSYVIPKEYNDAKIFIGFATKQSTGLRSHLALNQLIPTMERSAVDMSNQFVKEWNSEMLYMAGAVTRFACEHELSICKNYSSIDQASKDAEFIWSRFKFGQSAPDTVIGLHIKSGFWNSKSTTLVPSNMGVLPNVDVRLAGDAAEFLRITPLVADTELANDLKAVNLVSQISNSEIADDIRSSPINCNLAKKYLKWLMKNRSEFGDSEIHNLLDVATIMHEGKCYPMSKMRFYHDRSKLPDDEISKHLPNNCLSSGLSLQLGYQDLQSFGLQPLSILLWASFRLKCIDSDVFDEKKQSSMIKVLQEMCKTWDRISKSTRQSLITLCNNYKCIPTNSGLCFPNQSYVKAMKLFPDLPVVLIDANLPEVWLVEIGVRRSMDMVFVLKALNDCQLKWKNEDLLYYLEENESVLTGNDWKILCNGRFFRRKGEAVSLFTAGELYPPNINLQTLALPTIDLQTWNENSRQAHILFKVGLQRFPPPSKLFDNIKNPRSCDIALQYFLDNFFEAKYSADQIQDYQIIPIEQSSITVKPTECYADNAIAIFGLHVLKHKWHPFASRLGIKQRPSISYLVLLVLQNPSHFLENSSRCQQIFSYFAKHAGEFTDKDIKYCQQTQFIPINSEKGQIEWFTPKQVFLPYCGTDAEEEDLLRPVLKTVNPTRQSLPFFQLLGVHDKPTLSQLVQIVAENPQRIFSLCPTIDHYESILNQMETKWAIISRNEKLLKLMKSSDFLVGYKYNRSNFSQQDGISCEIGLYRPDQLAIVDDIVIFNQFKEQIITCPQQESLEKLYSRFSVPRISELLREDVVFGKVIFDAQKQKNLEERIRERVALFKENTSKDMKPSASPIEVVFVSTIECRWQLPPNASKTVFPTAYMYPGTNHRLCVVYRSYEWIDIATALVKSLLVKPDQDSNVVLEIQLSSDADTLERKGYNVQRIRQAKLEKIKKSAKMILQDDTKSSNVISTDNSKPSNQKLLENAANSKTSEFQTETQQPQTQQPQTPEPPQIFHTQKPSNPVKPSFLKPSLTSNKPKPSWMQYFMGQQSQNKPDNSSPVSMGSSIVPPSDNLSQNTKSTMDIQQALNLGLSSAREYANSDITKSIHIDRPSPMGSERSCDGFNKAAKLTNIGFLDCGMKVFTDISQTIPRQNEIKLGETLVLLCSIYGYPVEAVNIFREKSNVIAFNANGSLFFNSWHVPPISCLLDYYYPIMAHELAHNLATDHGASHSSFTESYIQFTLEKYINFRM